MDSPALIEVFKETYHIPQEIALQYCPPEGIVTNREVGEVIIPIIAFIEVEWLSPWVVLQEITFTIVGFVPTNAHLISLGS